MAATYFGVNAQGAKKDVSSGSSTTSKKVEVVIDSTISKKEALKLLQVLESAIKESTAIS